ncbi:MAG TPA: DUF1573 domain-containing protein [Verrucomicrobiae bacterium]|nr:DUF1573 domain-containing protein [Verrucomicrobiae bacterium]
MRKLSRNVLSFLMITAGISATAADTQPAGSDLSAPAKPAPTPPPSLQGPKAEYATPVYDFGRVQSGELVKYTYVVTNTGDQTLEISHVQPSCGCTAAGEWTHKVEPGETGKIPIQFNSANFNGAIFKTISVSSNDKTKPVMVLQLKGTVWKPIELLPAYTVINVPPDSGHASASIRIINHSDDPLAVYAPTCDSPLFAFALTTNEPGKEYTLALNSTNDLVGPNNLHGKLTLTTSSTKTPKLDIPFWVNVQPVITVIPQRISLAQTPLKAKSPTTITISNNSTNALTLSDAAVNAPGVEVQLKEVQPGRLFNAIVVFPEGFEPAAGKPLELTMKSSQPRMPEIKVPVLTAPHPVMTQPLVPQPQKPTASVSGAPSPTAPAVR